MSFSYCFSIYVHTDVFFYRSAHWGVDPWTDCDCETGQRTREVACVMQGGVCLAVELDEACSQSDKPASTEECDCADP